MKSIKEILLEVEKLEERNEEERKETIDVLVNEFIGKYTNETV